MAFSKAKRFVPAKGEMNPPVGLYNVQKNISNASLNMSKSFRRDVSNLSNLSLEGSTKIFGFQNRTERMELEREIRRLLSDRSNLLKKLVEKESELMKVSNRLQKTIQDKTHLESSIVTLKMELKQLRKCNDIFKTKMSTLEATGMKRADLRVELANTRGLLVSKEYDISDLQCQLETLTRKLNEQQEVIGQQDQQIEALRSHLAQEKKSLDESDRSMFELPKSDESPNFDISHTDDGNGNCDSGDKPISLSDETCEFYADSCKIQTAYESSMTDEINTHFSDYLNLPTENTGNDVDATTTVSLHALQDYRDTLEMRVSMLKAHNEDLEAQCDRSVKIISSLELQNENIKSEMSQVEQVLKDTTAELNALKSKMQLMTDNELALNNDIKCLREKCRELEDAHALEENEARRKVTSLEEELEESQLTVAKMQSLMADLTSNNTELEDKNRSYEVQFKNHKNQLFTKDAEIKELNEEVTVYKARYQKKKSENKKQSEDLTKLKQTMNTKEEDSNAKLAESTLKFQSLQKDLLKETEDSKLKAALIESLEEQLQSMEIECFVRNSKLEDINSKCEEMKKKIEAEAGLLQTSLNEKVSQNEELENQRKELVENNEKQEKVIADLAQSLNDAMENSSSKISEFEEENKKINHMYLDAVSAMNFKEKQLLEVNSLLLEMEDGSNMEKLDCEEMLVDRLDRIKKSLLNKEMQLLEEKEQKDKLALDFQQQKELTENFSCEIKKIKQKLNDTEQMMMEKVNKVATLEKQLSEKEDVLNGIYSKLRDHEDELLEKHSIIEHYVCRMEEHEEKFVDQESRLAEFQEEVACTRRDNELKDQEIHRLSVVVAEKDLHLNHQQELLGRHQSELNSLHQKWNEAVTECQNMNVQLQTVLNEQDAKDKMIEELMEVKKSFLLIRSRVKEISGKVFKDLNLSGPLAFDMNSTALLSYTENISVDELNETTGSVNSECQQYLLDELEKFSEATQEQSNYIQHLQNSNKQLIDRQKQMDAELEKYKAHSEWYANHEKLMVEEISHIEEQMSAAKEDGLRWKTLYEELGRKIEPFKDQLDMYATEAAALLNQNVEKSSEIQRLYQQYAMLLGHQNHKQKIHHVLKLKDENLKSKQENGRLQQQIKHLQNRVSKLQDKLDETHGRRRFDPTKAFVHNKENSCSSYGQC